MSKGVVELFIPVFWDVLFTKFVVVIGSDLAEINRLGR